MSFLEKYLETLKATGLLGELTSNDLKQKEQRVKYLQTRVATEVLAIMVAITPDNMQPLSASKMLDIRSF